MTGEKQIIDIRKRGLKPTCIFFEIGAPIGSGCRFDDPEKALGFKLFPTVFVRPSDLKRHLDLRFVVGIRSHLKADSLNEDVLMFADKLVAAGCPHLILCGVEKMDLMEFKNGEWQAWTS